jgi:hypothetical protein
VFTPAEREKLVEELLERARRDERISGGAITGSGSAGLLDRWSDIDLAFGVDDAKPLDPVLGDFSHYMFERHDAVDTVDVRRDPWIYRVFLLPTTLQVDLAFAPRSHFGALAPSFKLVFGTAHEVPQMGSRDARELVGYGWLYALHVRSSIARGRPWQALYMLNSMRDQVLALACLAAGLPTSEARGVDRLPPTITGPLEASIAHSLRLDDLRAAFAAAGEALIDQARGIDAALAARLEPVVGQLVSTSAAG